MPKQWVKKELKKNEVARVTERAAGWVLTHRDLALGLAGTVLGAVFLGFYGLSRYQDLRNSAWERLAFAENYAFAGQTKTADDQLKTLVQQYPRTKAAGFGGLFDADVLFQTGDYQGAIAAYQKILDRQNPTLTPYAIAGIAIAQEAAGQYQAAYDTTQRFLATYQDHFLAPQVHAIMARCLLAMGRADEAKSTMEKIALLYPQTAWADWANSVLEPASAKTAAASKLPPISMRAPGNGAPKLTPEQMKAIMARVAAMRKAGKLPPASPKAASQAPAPLPPVPAATPVSAAH